MIKNLRRNKKSIFRVLYLYIIFGIAVMPVTTSYFIDIETSTGNTFTASSLDFSLVTTNPGSPVEEKLIDEEIVYGDVIKEEVVIKSDGNLSFDYEILFEKTGGNSDLCSNLMVDVEQDEVDRYSGPLENVHAFEFDLEGSSDEIDFEVYLGSSDENIQGKVCEFNLIFKTVGDGFSDEESIITNTIETGWWVAPSVKVLSPNGGEEYVLGESVDIEWEAESSDSDATHDMEIDIYLSVDGGVTYPRKLAENTENDGVWGWIVDEKSSEMRVKVIAEDEYGLVGEDESDENFDPVESDNEDKEEEGANDAEEEDVEIEVSGEDIQEEPVPESLPPEEDEKEKEEPSDEEPELEEEESSEGSEDEEI